MSFETNVVFEGVLEAYKIKAIEDTELAEKINYLHEMEKAGKENSKYPVTIESASYEEAIYESCILNSQSLSKKETGAYCGSYVAMALANEGGFKKQGIVTAIQRILKSCSTEILVRRLFL